MCQPPLRSDMTNSDRVERFLRTKFQNAGKQYEEARRAFATARQEAAGESVSDGTVRIVCRRYAERRAVGLDSEGRPDCFAAGHPDCEGCVEDIRSGCIETW